MVNFSKLAAGAKKAVEAAGGPDAVKDKAADLKKVAQGPGTFSDKAKRAAEVVREKEGAAAPRPAAAAQAPVPAPAASADEEARRRERKRERRAGRDERA